MSDDLDSTDEKVRIYLDDDEVLISESYEIKQAILTQPAAFSLRIGNGAAAAGLIKSYPANTAFALSIGGVIQQTGYTDGPEAEGSTGATEVVIRGRDAMAPLLRSYIKADESIANATFADVVQKALDDSGIKDYILSYSNEANRQALTGIGVKQLGPPPDQNGTASVDALATSQQSGSVNKAVQVKVGEKQYDHVKKILDRAGLFLWATADGNFILSAPNGNQQPAYRIIRQRGSDRDAVNVETARYKNETTNRHSEYIVYGRGGGLKFGRQTAMGSFVDQEMVALGYDQPFVCKDDAVTNSTQAAFYARRKCAEARRQDWQLSYTLRGHTTPSLLGGQRAVWAVDTIVDVQDDEFGVYGPHYIETVEFRRNPQTTTTITLMRPEDLVFALEAP